MLQDQKRAGNAGGKGPGKGGQGSGKGPSGPWVRNAFGKGGKGGKSFGGKGGFRGKCFKCGEAGHRRWECTKVGAVDEEAPGAEAPTYHVESVWDIGVVDVVNGEAGAAQPPPVASADVLAETVRTLREKRMRRAPRDGSRFRVLQPDGDDDAHDDTPCMVGAVHGQSLTREAQLDFSEADVRKPLASAVRVAKAGNGIWLEAGGGYIVNLATQERMGGEGRERGVRDRCAVR